MPAEQILYKFSGLPLATSLNVRYSSSTLNAPTGPFMALLPFLFKAEEFYPLQPEDAQAEESLRTNPSYASMYRNIAEEYYTRLDGTSQPVEDQPVVNDYNDWLAACRAIDEKVLAAHRRWKEACTRRDAMIVQLKRECEDLRFEYHEAKRTIKPPQPRSARRQQ